MSSPSTVFKLASLGNTSEFRRHISKIKKKKDSEEREALLKGIFLTDTKGRQLTHIAAKGGHTKFLCQLVELGFKINEKCAKGNTPLHYACAEASLPCVITLLGYGADISILNNDVETAFDVIPEKKQAQLGSVLRAAVKRRMKILSENIKLDVNERLESITSSNIEQNPYPIPELENVEISPEQELATGPAVKFCKGEFSSVKVMVKMTTDTSDACLLEEANFLRYIRHSNILLLLGISNKQHLIFENASHGFLHRVLFRSKLVLQTDEILGIARDIASALKYLHGSGFIHCAVASFSIALTRGLTAKICNFTNTQRIQYQKPISHVTALYPYMALNQLQGYPANESNDIYGLGAVIYECATREKMRDVKTALRHHDEKAEMTYMMKRVPYLGTTLFLLLQACLGKAKRRPTAEQIADWLNAILYGRLATIAPSSMVAEDLPTLEHFLMKEHEN